MPPQVTSLSLGLRITLLVKPIVSGEQAFWSRVEEWQQMQLRRASHDTALQRAGIKTSTVPADTQVRFKLCVCAEMHYRPAQRVRCPNP